MEVLIKTTQFILSLSILIILHELGHFIPAKLFKTRVEKFYLFFDPWFSLFKFKKKDTEYGIGWLPLGGYVKIAGMVDESMDKEQLKQPPQPWEFRSKPSWQRLIIMVGGVTVNILLGMAIYSMVLFIWGDKYLPTSNLTDGIWCMDSLALETGLQNGDKIISVDYQKIDAFHKIIPFIVINQSQSIQVNRNGERIDIPVPSGFIQKFIEKKSSLIYPRIPFYVGGFSDASPAKEAGIKKRDKLIGIDGHFFKYFDEFKTDISNRNGDKVLVSLLRGKDTLTVPVKVNAEGLIGVAPAKFGIEELEKSGIYTFKTTQYSLFAAIPAGIAKAKNTLVDYVKQFKLILSPKTGAYKSLGGFISIGSLFTPEWDWEHFWGMTALLSIILAFMNILPIPALDGGHVLFLVYEMITGRKPGDKFLEYAQIAGMVLLLTLLVFANGNDFIRYFFN